MNTSLDILTLTMGQAVNLSGGWSKLWSAITSGWPGLTTVMSVIGVLMVVIALLTYAWQHRKGNSMAQGSNVIWGSLIIGALLAAPGLLFPLLLGILDWVINIVVKLFQGF